MTEARRSIVEQLTDAAKHQTSGNLGHQEITPATLDSATPQPPAEFQTPADPGREDAIPLKVYYQGTTRMLLHGFGCPDEVQQFEGVVDILEAGWWCRTFMPEWGTVHEHCVCGVYQLERA